MAEWGSPKEKETLRRILLARAAWVYENGGEFYMSDAAFDRLALAVDLSIKTDRPRLDRYFKKHFSPDTGQWVQRHPDKNLLHGWYLRWIEQGCKPVRLTSLLS